jgi:hypothetical protein
MRLLRRFLALPLMRLLPCLLMLGCGLRRLMLLPRLMLLSRLRFALLLARWLVLLVSRSIAGQNQE